MPRFRFIPLLLSLYVLASCGPQTIESPQTAATDLVIAPRSAWDAGPDKPDLMTPNGTIRFVTIHHTATPDTIPEVRHLQSIQEFHQDEDHNWGDIAYHYLIGPSGTIYEGRAEQYAPSSGTVYITPEQWTAAGQNDLGQTAASVPLDADGQEVERPGASAGHLIIAVLGDYSEVLPTTEARDAVVRLAAAKLYEYGLSADDVYFHREVAVVSDCPGQRFYDWFRGPERRYQSRGPGLDRIAAELDRLRASN